ncbi:hypothetical protein SARC_11154 [Sphaeroforma arctica JP610]|uniref:RGS domain-containing protein n=1 Tax=Sphaeroforma arctica JP610 TaxID=667725 RepID=A0A0L0FIM8_9EUKA|nr:hypothetical protein SARC_11154 [Sphaeroforma arctica JP610]KNC76336.1 hypothetical protein SARC_11154 [Sphaeroforma arctica JP610]|eukprot:XP_014150238.1 hypothetical protein SARC_11154 [Sphaeroforma arctica JP610]
MRLAKQKQQLHQQQQLEAFSIFTMHFSSGAPFPVPVPQDIIKKMEASLKDSILGPAPLVFEEAQASVYRLMRREYYPRFRHSLIYRKFLESRDDGSTVGQTIDARDIPYTHSRTPSGAIKVQDTTNNTTNDPNTTRDDIVDTIDTVTEVEEEVREAAINANLSVASEVKYSQPMDISGQSIQSHSSIHSEKSVGADVEEPEANHGSPTSQSEGHNAIGAAIALMKEQQLIVEDLIIASVPGSKQYKTLINQQEAIGFELAQLMAMGLMNQDEEVMEGMTVDVGSVDVEAQGDNLGKVVYLIEVAQYSGTKFLSGWMLTKDYDDVEELYAKLSLHFAKVKQIPFPVCPKKDMFGRPGNVGSSLTLNKQGVLRKREEKKEQHRKAINR